MAFDFNPILLVWLFIAISAGLAFEAVYLMSASASSYRKRINRRLALTQDRTDRQSVLVFFDRNKPDYVFHMAGFVRGIMGNMRNQGESYLRNTLINTHVASPTPALERGERVQSVPLTRRT